MIYKIEAEGDTMYYYADSEDEAYQRITKFIGPMPRKLLKFTRIADSEVPEGQEVL
jgi:hypothetical protein